MAFTLHRDGQRMAINRNLERIAKLEFSIEGRGENEFIFVRISGNKTWGCISDAVKNQKTLHTSLYVK